MNTALHVIIMQIISYFVCRHCSTCNHPMWT